MRPELFLPRKSSRFWPLRLRRALRIPSPPPSLAPQGQNSRVFLNFHSTSTIHSPPLLRTERIVLRKRSLHTYEDIHPPHVYRISPLPPDSCTPPPPQNPVSYTGRHHPTQPYPPSNTHTPASGVSSYGVVCVFVVSSVLLSTSIFPDFIPILFSLSPLLCFDLLCFAAGFASLARETSSVYRRRVYSVFVFFLPLSKKYALPPPPFSASLTFLLLLERNLLLRSGPGISGNLSLEPRHLCESRCLLLHQCRLSDGRVVPLSLTRLGCRRRVSELLQQAKKEMDPVSAGKQQKRLHDRTGRRPLTCFCVYALNFLLFFFDTPITFKAGVQSQKKNKTKKKTTATYTHTHLALSFAFRPSPPPLLPACGSKDS